MSPAARWQRVRASPSVGSRATGQFAGQELHPGHSSHVGSAAAATISAGTWRTAVLMEREALQWVWPAQSQSPCPNQHMGTTWARTRQEGRMLVARLESSVTWLGSRRVELGSSEPGKYWPGYSHRSPFSFPGRLCLGKQSSNVPQITKLFSLHLKCQRHFLTPPCGEVRTLHTSVLSQRGNR